MAEPRKIVLILGNGFDLDLGLKTSYKDFWESDYCPKKYPAPLIRHLKQASYDNSVRKNITIFTRDDDSVVEIKRALQKMTDGKLSSLFSINQPKIIRTANIEKDKQIMLDFLVAHRIDEYSAAKYIGNILS